MASTAPSTNPGKEAPRADNSGHNPTVKPAEKNTGYAATLIFGLVGMLVGGGIGVLTAGFVAPDDLSGLGVALIWIVLLASLCAGGGVAVGLTTRNHVKAGLTAVLAAPATFISAFGGLIVIATFVDPSAEGWIRALLGWGLEALLVALALTAVRWLSLTIGKRA